MKGGFRMGFIEKKNEWGHTVYVPQDVVELKINRIPIIKTIRRKGGYPVPYYVNCHTTEGSWELNEVVEEDVPYQVIRAKGKEMKGAKYMYDEYNQAVAIIICTLDTSEIVTKKKKREWVEDERIYIFPDKRILSNRRNTSRKQDINVNEYLSFAYYLNSIYGNSGPNSFVTIDSPGLLVDEKGLEAWDQTEAMEPFRRMWGSVVTLQGNRMIAIDSVSALNGFMHYKQPNSNNTGKKQKKLEKLLSYTLPDVPEPKGLPEIKRDFSWEGKNLSPFFENLQKYAVIQRVEGTDEPTCVIRTFFKSPTLHITKEGGRIYVTKKDITSSRVTNEGLYIYQPLLNNPVHWNFFIGDFDSRVTDGTMLEYYGQIIGEIDPKYRGLAIWSFIKWPITEQMYKIDCFKDFMNKIFMMSVIDTPMKNLETCLGKIDTRQKNVFKAIGMNRAQAEIIIPLLAQYMPKITTGGYVLTRGPIARVKQIFSANTDNIYRFFCEYHDMSDIDIDMVKFAVKQSLELVHKCHKYMEYNPKIFMSWKDYGEIHDEQRCMDEMMNALAEAVCCYGINILKKISPMLMGLIDVAARRRERLNDVPTWYCGSIYTTFVDYVRMVRLLGMQSNLKPYFKKPEDVFLMHDAILELYNTKQTEIEHREWVNRANEKNWKKWEYKSGKFITVAPKEPDELAIEGITLHHCVKSYIGKVAKGITNIMFIRQENEPDKPFFTVEIDNCDVIQQVHGMSNCCAETVEGLPEFVKEWANSKSLKIWHMNKVR